MSCSSSQRQREKRATRRGDSRREPSRRDAVTRFADPRRHCATTSRVAASRAAARLQRHRRRRAFSLGLHRLQLGSLLGLSSAAPAEGVRLCGGDAWRRSCICRCAARSSSQRSWGRLCARCNRRPSAMISSGRSCCRKGSAGGVPRASLRLRGFFYVTPAPSQLRRGAASAPHLQRPFAAAATLPAAGGAHFTAVLPAPLARWGKKGGVRGSSLAEAAPPGGHSARSAERRCSPWAQTTRASKQGSSRAVIS